MYATATQKQMNKNSTTGSRNKAGLRCRTVLDAVALTIKEQWLIAVTLPIADTSEVLRRLADRQENGENIEFEGSNRLRARGAVGRPNAFAGESMQWRLQAASGRGLA